MLGLRDFEGFWNLGLKGFRVKRNISLRVLALKDFFGLKDVGIKGC